MKKINPIIMMVAVTILFAFTASCAGDDNKNEMQQQMYPEITAYMEIKNALVKDDSQAAQPFNKE